MRSPQNLRKLAMAVGRGREREREREREGKRKSEGGGGERGTRKESGTQMYVC
jgi:hypothetical protein